MKTYRGGVCNGEKLICKNIVIWGTQIYFRENIEKFSKKCRDIRYVYPDGSINDEIKKRYKILESLEEIQHIENCFVIIAKGKSEDISIIAKKLRERNILYDHMDFYVKERLNIRYLKALKYYDYTDENNNRFRISPKTPDKVVIRRMGCKNATLSIGSNHISRQLFITLMGESANICIGENNTFVDVVINVCTEGKVIIGNDNMFSHHVVLNQSDMHHIFDLNRGKRINYSKNIIIDNHVWIGREVELLGGAHISDNSICGTRAVTSSVFPKNVIIAGCPGKVIRENIIWARDDLKIYNHDNFDEAHDQSGKKYL